MANTNTQFMMVPIFNHQKDDFRIYKGRLLSSFTTLKIETDDQKKATLLSALHETTYTLIYKLTSPSDPSNVTLEKLYEILNKYCSKQTLVWKERRAFMELRKAEGESVQDWVVKIRDCASECKFGDRLDEMLIDKFVTGTSGKLFDRLCEEDEKQTLEKLVSIAERYELRKTTASQEIEVNMIKSDKNRYKTTTTHQGSPNMKYNSCVHCGYNNHAERDCKYKNFVCNKCKVKGHMASVCKVQTGSRVRNRKYIRAMSDAESNSDSEIYGIYGNDVSINKVDNKLVLVLDIENIKLKFMIDTGAAVSAIPEHIFDKHFNVNLLEPDDSIITGYGGEQLSIKGIFRHKVHYNNMTKECKFYVIRNASNCIVGRNFFELFQVREIKLNNVNHEEGRLKDIVDSFSDLFGRSIGKLKDVKVKLEFNQEIEPIFVKARPVPFAFREAIEKQLHDLQIDGIITKTESTEWGTPLVPILKDDGQIRICADYKVTINRYLKDTNYPLPRIKEIMARLHGNKYFSKLDLSRAYNQIELEDDSKKCVTWSTHVGNYVMNRLPYGVKPATGLFQREIEKVLHNIPGTINFLDDIIVSAPNLRQHNERLKLVFERLRSANLKLRKSKCTYAKESIQYLGHTITEEGFRKIDDRNKILDMRVPENVSELKSFCGFINYYGKFINNLATKMAPLYELLKKNQSYEWTQECQTAFQNMKSEVVSDVVLVHYDPKIQIVLTCDASNVGIGAVISHSYPDGTERPIEFASRMLTQAEKNYGVIQKEALAIVYGTKKFFQYLIGTHFTLVTDHKPLLSIFGEKKGIPQMSASRLQRWAVHLAAFNFTIKHVNSDKNQADLLSRIPIDPVPKELDNDTSYLYFVSQNKDIPIQFKTVYNETIKDEILVSVIKAVRNNNFIDIPNDEEYKRLLRNRTELTVENEILMRGHRIVIPKALRAHILREAHASHLGIVKTKSLLRSYVWWPSIDSDIEDLIKGCDACLSVLPNPQKAECILWTIPTKPFERLHLDYAGPINDKYLLIVIDAKSKWLEVFVTRHATAEFTLRKLKEVIARFGYPNHVVSDNGTQFTAEIFKEFARNHGIKVTYTAPGFPASNGAAENAVKTVKNAIKTKIFGTKVDATMDLENIINDFLIDYRNIDHCTSGIKPSSQVFRFNPKLRFDLLKQKNCETNDFEVMAKESNRKFVEGEEVIIRDYTVINKPRWVNAQIIKVLGARNYICRMTNGRNIKRHIDQIRSRTINSKNETRYEKSETSHDIDKALNRKNNVRSEYILLKENNNVHQPNPNEQREYNHSIVINDNLRKLRDRDKIVKPDRLDL